MNSFTNIDSTVAPKFRNSSQFYWNLAECILYKFNFGHFEAYKPRCINVLVNKYINKLLIYEWTNEWMNEWIIERINEWMNE